MKMRFEYLRRWRELLIVQAAGQRGEVSSITLHMPKRRWPVDMGFVIVQAMRKHPRLAVASVKLLFPVSRNKLLLLSSRLLTAWESFY